MTDSFLITIVDEALPRQATLSKGAISVQGNFDLEDTSGSRFTGVLAKIESGRCTLDDFRDVGSQLFQSVFSEKLRKFFESETQACTEEILLRLCLPPKLQQHPWEALYDERREAFFSTNPRFCIVRDPPTGIRTPEKMREDLLPLRMLVIIPSGSGLDVEREWRNLDQAVGRLRGRIVAERVDGPVTPDRLQEKLRGGACDILHFIGHGEVSTDGEFTIRLNSPRGHDDDHWMEAEVFSSLFYQHAPKLVVLNCCLGAVASSKRTLSGLGPALIKAGVPAVIAMRYEIGDDVAIRFADKLYNELLNGENPGRIDTALANARNSVFLNHGSGSPRAFATPVMYMVPGNENLFRIPRADVLLPPTPVIDSEGRRMPADLKECLKKIERKNCVVVIGPDVLRTGATRSSNTPTLLDLAERLAKESEYPWSGDGDITKAADWVSTLLLPRVCQHYQQRFRRYRLVEAIEEVYLDIEPPEPLISLAAMDFPAIVYTHFDGLMEAAFTKIRKTHQLIPLASPRNEIPGKEGWLITLRGNFRHPDKTLVLTEDDQEEVIYEYLPSLSPVIRDQLSGRVGCSAIFIGTSPRDFLVRRFSNKILEAGERRNQGPTYFISPQLSSSDRAYWAKYDARWIEMDLSNFFEILTGRSI